MKSLFEDAVAKSIDERGVGVATRDGVDMGPGGKGTPGAISEVTFVDMPGGYKTDSKMPNIPLGSTISGFPKNK